MNKHKYPKFTILHLLNFGSSVAFPIHKFYKVLRLFSRRAQEIKINFSHNAENVTQNIISLQKVSV